MENKLKIGECVLLTMAFKEFHMCITVYCEWWDEIKKQCCIKTLSRLNVSGVITTHKG